MIPNWFNNYSDFQSIYSVSSITSLCGITNKSSQYFFFSFCLQITAWAHLFYSSPVWWKVTMGTVLGPTVLRSLKTWKLCLAGDWLGRGLAHNPGTHKNTFVLNSSVIRQIPKLQHSSGIICYEKQGFLTGSFCLWNKFYFHKMKRPQVSFCLTLLFPILLFHAYWYFEFENGFSPASCENVAVPLIERSCERRWC